MATQNTYYLNAASFNSATGIYLDEGLTELVPNGFYSDGVSVRQMLDGVLYPAQVCDSCCEISIDSFSVTDDSATIYFSNSIGSTSYSIDGGALIPFTGNPLVVTGLSPTITYEITIVDSYGCAASIDVETIPSCPDRRVVIQICNSNSARDDNFDIYLNDNYIGAVNLNANEQIGSVFIADLNPSLTITSSDFVCPLTGMVTYRFDPAFLQANNVLEMRNTQNNDNGNLGSVGIRNYLLSGTSLSSPCVVADLQYSGASGTSFTFNFNYTACCEEVV